MILLDYLASFVILASICARLVGLFLHIFHCALALSPAAEWLCFCGLVSVPTEFLLPRGAKDALLLALGFVFAPSTSYFDAVFKESFVLLDYLASFGK